MKTKCIWTLGVVAALMALAPRPSVASILIYSDMGSPGNYSYQSSDGYLVSGPTASVPPSPIAVSDASPFTASGNFSVGEIDVGLSNVAGTETADLSVWTDAGGTPGTQIGSTYQLTGLPVNGSCCAVASVTGITGINLISGDTYFVVITAGASDTYDAWNFANTAMGSFDQQTDNGPWYEDVGDPENSLGAFAVLSAPEPGTLILLLMGLVGLACLTRRRLPLRT